ncbi:hypothetical protein NZL82_15560 [Sphingomonas sanguinis]|uniref:hypothetical protein n=1 Tax=Sphingomonas sp. LC-1 TaxID=3110957 RepID=UPI0021BB7159|nr:hypothetical protein [Sphingomonas sp. LC-1]MCT8003293.1 hypothetical protein [Sphingomonas sp. LC-1]
MWISDDGRLTLGWHIKGYTLAQNIEARRLYGEIENSERRHRAVMNRVAARN